MTELTPAEASAIVGDDIEYWLGNPFMTPALLAEKAAWWVAAARAEGARDMRGKIEALPDEMAAAWGGDASWLTTGDRVADLVRDWLREELQS